MLHSWDPALSPWLPLLVLIGVPVVAAAAFRLTPLRVGERLVSSKAYRVLLVVFFLLGIVECVLAVYLAVLVPDIIAAYPKEYWRWIGGVALLALLGGVIFGIGVRALRNARRPSS